MKEALEKVKGKVITIVFDKNHKITGRVEEVLGGSIRFSLRELFESELDTYVAIDKIRYFFHSTNQGKR